jgi:predicted AlkP superfamily pyrophosphatase or phosphodiesterase
MSDIPSYVPTLQHTHTTAAVTYNLTGARGWALCTVNDQTGELSIQSDWGIWGHRWSTNPASLGAPTLTAFLGDMDAASDYVANKLTSRRGGDKPLREEFDCAATVSSIRAMICAYRREVAASGWGAQRFTAEVARQIWDDLTDLEHINDATFFLSTAMNIANFDLLGEEYDSLLVYVDTPSYCVLRHGILPPLYAACRTAHLTAQEVPHAP